MSTPRRSIRAHLALVLTVCTLGTLAVPSAAHADVTNPVVRGPIYGGIHNRAFNSSLYDVAANGYTEREYFISGVATDITDGSTAPYTSRILVRHPANPWRFNGTVVVEWNNVTGGMDLETLWPATGQYGMDEGFAWVSVSAQAVGANQLKWWDPVRYARIVHPGDDYSYDIYNQAMAAVKFPRSNHTAVETPARVDPMDGLVVRNVIAHGASQSASRLTSYITLGYHKAADLADAFSITRGGGGADVARIAGETKTLVVQVQEEAQGARPADTPYYVVYEEAGIAHAPVPWYQYIWRMQTRDLVGLSPIPDAAGAACSMNRGTSDYTHRMHLLHLHLWLRFGIVPPSGPRLSRDAGGALLRDADGLALGGIRYPFVAVPVSYNSSGGCPLFGQYRPWSREKILGLYPTRDAYVDAVDDVVAGLLHDGLILWQDALDAKADARAFDAWDAGSCFDTASPSSSESGPVTSQTHGLAYSTETLGVPNAIHEASCTLASAGA